MGRWSRLSNAHCALDSCEVGHWYKWWGISQQRCWVAGIHHLASTHQPMWNFFDRMGIQGPRGALETSSNTCVSKHFWSSIVLLKCCSGQHLETIESSLSTNILCWHLNVHCPWTWPGHLKTSIQLSLWELMGPPVYGGLVLTSTLAPKKIAIRSGGGSVWCHLPQAADGPLAAD